MVSSGLHPVVYRVLVRRFSRWYVVHGAPFFSGQPTFAGGLFFFLLTETTVCVTLSAETEVVLFMLPQTVRDVNQKEKRFCGGFLWSLVRD